jgi:hypothetical protein
MRLLRSAFHSFVDHCPNFETWQATLSGRGRSPFPSVRSSSGPRLFGNSRRPRHDVAASWADRPRRSDPSDFERSPTPPVGPQGPAGPWIGDQDSNFEPTSGEWFDDGSPGRSGTTSIRRWAARSAAGEGVLRVSEDVGSDPGGVDRPIRTLPAGRSGSRGTVGHDRRPAADVEVDGHADSAGPGMEPRGRPRGGHAPAGPGPGPSRLDRPVRTQVEPAVPGPERVGRHEPGRCRNSATPSTLGSPSKE